MNCAINFEEVQSDTAAFSCLSPTARAFVLAAIFYHCNSLLWPHRARNVLMAIEIALGGESAEVSYPHYALGAVLYPTKASKAQRDAVSKDLRLLRDAQLSTGYKALGVVSGDKVRLPEGGYQSRPTLYRADHLYVVFDRIQRLALECDLGSLPNGRWQMKMRAIVAQVNRERGYQPISKERKSKTSKSHRCDDPDCKDCPVHCEAARRAESEVISEGYVLERMMRLPLDRRYDFALTLNSLMMQSMIPDFEEHREAAAFIEKMKLQIDQADRIFLMERREQTKRANQRHLRRVK